MDNINACMAMARRLFVRIRYGAAEWFIYGIELDCGDWMPRPLCDVICRAYSVLVFELFRVNCRMFVFWNYLHGYIKRSYRTRLDSDCETRSLRLDKVGNCWFSWRLSQLVGWGYWVVYCAISANRSVEIRLVLFVKYPNYVLSSFFYRSIDCWNSLSLT